MTTEALKGQAVLRLGRFARFALGLSVLIAGTCAAQHAKVDTTAFKSPQTIVLVDIPRMNPVAYIGVLTMYMPGNLQHHFTERTDRFFDVPGATAAATSSSSNLQQGLIGAMIMGNAEETQRRAAAF